VRIHQELNGGAGQGRIKSIPPGGQYSRTFLDGQGLRSDDHSRHGLPPSLRGICRPTTP
jgi:hypothetical protein